MYIIYIFQSFDIIDEIIFEIKCMDSFDASEAMDIPQFVVAEIEYLDVGDWYESIDILQFFIIKD